MSKNTSINAVKLQRDIRNAFFDENPRQDVAELARRLEKMALSNKKWSAFFKSRQTLRAT